MAKAAPSAEKAIDLLVVGERSDDLAYLRRLLDQALNGSVQVDWAYSPDEALETEKKHDLVLWDCSGRENGFSLSDKSAASIFLGDPVHEQKVLATVQACVGDSAECHSRIPCRTLAL